MHIRGDSHRDLNVIAAWAVAVSDAVRVAAESATGMTGNGPAALVAIVADPEMSIDELRRVLELTHPGAVRLVDRLADHGWVERRQGPGRTIRLVPTTAGRKVARKLAAAREGAVSDLLNVMRSQDIHTIAGLVEPVLGEVIDDVDAMRRLCRLCDRSVCTDCPAEAAQ